MTEPIVFISRNRIREGKAGDFALMFGQAVGLIGSSKPRTALFAAYVDAAGTEVSVVHAFPDAEALLMHFDGSNERASSVSDVIVPTGFEILGRAPEAAIDQIRREAATAGVSLLLQSNPIGGFLRPPA